MWLKKSSRFLLTGKSFNRTELNWDWEVLERRPRVKPMKESLPSLLSTYRETFPHESPTVDIIIQFIERNPEGFQRKNLEGHVTGSAWVVDPAGEKVLLTHHKKLGKWLQLGGHADGEKDVLRVAIREAQEESGLAGLVPVSEQIFDVDIHAIPERPGEPSHFHYDIRFAVKASKTEPLVVSGESRELAWVPISDLARYSGEESLLRMKRKWESPL